MTPAGEQAMRTREAARAFEEAQLELDYRAGLSRACNRTPITPERWEELDALFTHGDLGRVIGQCRADPDEWYQFVFERDLVAWHMRDVRVTRARAEAWRFETQDDRLDGEYEARMRERRAVRDEWGGPYPKGHSNI